LIVGGAVAIAAGVLAWRALRPKPPIERPSGVPLSPFTDAVTAEGVTAGLDLTGRRVLITGVTSGIGQEAMRVLAARGAHVYGTGRTLDKAAAACAAVAGRTTPLALELTDFDSVVACAEAVGTGTEPLDMILCNAGIMALPELQQSYGLEQQFVTNHLGHFLLVNRLLAQVRAAPAGRVVVVSSSALKWADPAGIEWDNLSGARDYDGRRAYGQSKLANALFSLELARRLAGTSATSNAMNPGAVLTRLQRHAPAWAVRLGDWLGPAFMKSPAEGAATLCYLAAHPQVSGVSGYFFENCNPVRRRDNSENEAMAGRLWDVSLGLVERWLK
jgi:NAD(P)-dependent dehydrogenase (short-subunit alcohol dehydrogenase family)